MDNLRDDSDDNSIDPELNFGQTINDVYTNEKVRKTPK